jgi:hypothetical protein
MPSRKTLVRHCRIMPWIQAQDEDFADAITDLCLEGALASRAKGSGITFLFPTAAVRKDVVAKAYSDKADEAVKLIRAHILPGVLQSAASFKIGTIGSKAEVVLKVKDIKGLAVELEGGALLEKAPSFKPLEERKNMVVWAVKSGAVPTTGAKFDFKAAERKKGGGPPAAGEFTFRQAAGRDVESEFEHRIEQLGDAACKTVSSVADAYEPFSRRVLALLNTLASTPEFHEDYLKALCVLDPNPIVNFYILFEPWAEHSKASQYFICQRAFESLGSGQSTHDNPAKFHRDLFENPAKAMGEKAKTAQIACNPTSVADAVRAFSLDKRGSMCITSAQDVISGVDEMISSNTIGGCKDVWPPCVAACLGGGRKLWQDLLRYNLRITQIELHRCGVHAPAGNLKDILVTMWHLVRVSFPGTDMEKEVHNHVFGHGGGRVERLTVCMFFTFVNSADLLYFPMPVAVVEKQPKGPHGGHPASAEPFNGADVSHTYLEAQASHTEAKPHDEHSDNLSSIIAGNAPAAGGESPVVEAPLAAPQSADLQADITAAET